jgi:nitronate monooxygenase
MMLATHPALARAEAFASAHGIRVPILLAPMAGACPPALSAAVVNAGGLGSCGALLMSPDAIRQWVAAVRATTNGPFNLNLWIPDPAPLRDRMCEENIRAFLGKWGPPVPETAGDVSPIDFSAQCEALLDSAPAIISSVMGLYPAPIVERLKTRGIKWFANVSTVTEALAVEAAGADVIVAQGIEAGGHRGCFDAARAEASMVGLFSLLPAIVDAVKVPVVATGGIADARGLAAALLLGASAVQIGTGFLRSPEAGLPTAWADAIANALPEHTIVSRVFSGRAGRSLATAYALAATSSDAPRPAPYPVQRALTQAMRDAAWKSNDIDRMQAWAGQSSRLVRAMPAGMIVDELWTGAKALLR